MTQAQTAITPEANPFAVFFAFNIIKEQPVVIEKLQQLASWVDELNQTQPNSELVCATSFSHQFWQHTNQAMPSELIPFSPLGEGQAFAPATSVDVLLHIHSNRHDLHFYLLRKLMAEIAEYVDVVDETYGYRYLDCRDMTEFVDGTENPEGEQRAQVALIADGEFAGGSYVLWQRFVHDLPAWNRLGVAAQEKVIGRTKPDSIELDDVPAASHVGRVDIKEEGKGLKLVRHSLPYGSVSGDHGLLFMAYCNRLHNLKVMLESMYGVTDGKTDQLLRFTKAVTGEYFFAPSQAMLMDLRWSK